MGTLLRLRNIDEPLDLERVVDLDNLTTLAINKVDKTKRISNEQLKTLAKLIRQQQAKDVATGWLKPDDAKRNLYLRAITRIRDKNECLDPSMPLMLDIRDKNDPKWSYENAIDHQISWDPGDKGFSYNG